jgi:integrase
MNDLGSYLRRQFKRLGQRALSELIQTAQVVASPGDGIKTEIGCHTFGATGIAAYLKNGGRLEVAQQMAAHESARTTAHYDRRSDEVSLDEVERIEI